MDKFTVDNARRSRWRDESAARRWALARKFVLGLSLAIACQSALAQAMYRIKPLGSLGNCSPYVPSARAFNKADRVTGVACLPNGDMHAFLWKNDGTPIMDIGPPDFSSWGTAVNASGLIAGYAENNSSAFAFLYAGGGTPLKKFYNEWGGSVIYAYALNDLGQLTGAADTAGAEEHAFVLKGDGSPMLDLGTLGGDLSIGYDINDAGQVVGESFLAGSSQYHAFVWNNNGSPMVDLGVGADGGGGNVTILVNASGQVAWIKQSPKFPLLRNVYFSRNDGTPRQALGTLGGRSSDLAALNDSGQIAGSSATSGFANRHAFVWLNDGTPMQDLGTFGGFDSAAHGMNSSGQVTGQASLGGGGGYHAFLWKNDGTRIQDLNNLIDPTDPLRPYITLTNAQFINDIGDIVAQGTDSRTGLEQTLLLQGTVLTLAPRALAFGNQPTNTTSAAKSVTVTNTSAKVVAITNIALKGSASGQFTSTNNCGASLVGHAACIIKVTFKPTTKGKTSATLNVNGGGGGLRTVTLTGTGT